MNISKPDINSDVYKQFIEMINHKVSAAVIWLTNHNIKYVWNNWINNHLYRLYIPEKDLLLDFEYYPLNNYGYNYIRINFDTDMIQLLERLFPEIILNTQDLEVWKLNQRVVNKFLRDNGASPVYDKNVLRLGWVKDQTIYQCIIVKNNKIIANVTKRNCSVMYGTYMMLRYLTEAFGYPEIIIKDSTDNSFTNTMYQLIGTKKISQTNKKKIWWSPNSAKWHIKREDTDKYVPFYYCESCVYKYSI